MEDYKNQILQQFTFGEIDQVLSDILKEPLSFGEILKGVITGDFTMLEGIEFISKNMVQQLIQDKNLILYIFILCLVASLYTVFTTNLKDKQVSETFFYVVYIMITLLLMKGFGELLATVRQGAVNLSMFMKVLIPSYSLGIAFSVGYESATGFYQCNLMMISILSDLLCIVLLPAIEIFVVLRLLNQLFMDDYTKAMADVFLKICGFFLKVAMSALIGMQVIQSMVLPAIDTFKNAAFTKGAMAIPGIGNSIGAVTELFMGAAILVKNGMGVVAIMIIIILVLPIFLKIFLYIAVFKILAALLQPVSDKRLTGCMESVCEGGIMVLKCSGMVAGMFMISIALIAMKTK